MHLTSFFPAVSAKLCEKKKKRISASLKKGFTQMKGVLDYDFKWFLTLVSV